MAKRIKKTLKVKQHMYKDTFDPNSESKYARKKKLQERGVFSEGSPFRPKSTEEEVN